MSSPKIVIGKRKIGPDFPPLVIAEIGINHGGSLAKAKQMIRDAKKAGAECVKFQSHILEDEMVPAAKKVIPGNTNISIWEVMERCALSEKEEKELKHYTEKLGMLYLCTPFSRAAANRLQKMGVKAFKIGSGECNNYPLLEHIASFGKPIILSTGMNDIPAVSKAVAIFRRYKVPFALLHCTSMYPTPYNKVRLGGLAQLGRVFGNVVIGLSDHSLDIWTSLAAVALGAAIIEKHFTSTKRWSGPDISISITPSQLRNLIIGSRAIWEARGGKKDILREEKPTIDFAYACVVATKDIKKGEKLTMKNIWVKRPGTGEIKAVEFKKILGKRAKTDIYKDQQLKWQQIEK